MHLWEKRRFRPFGDGFSPVHHSFQTVKNPDLLRHLGDWQDAEDELGYAFFKNWN